jgi:O-antigen/teichoic acid export membrane protein
MFLEIKKYVASLINKIFKAEIFRVFSFNALATLVKMLTGFVSIKIVAAIIGPIGVALIGQLNNFVTIAVNIASAGINNGITKYIAEYKNQEFIQKQYISSAAKIVLGFSLLTSLILIFFSDSISNMVLLSEEYAYIFKIFGLTIGFYGFNTLLVSIVNGYKEFKKFIYISICGSLIGLLFTVTLVVLFDLGGALIGIVTFQSIMFFVTILFVKKDTWFNSSYFTQKINTKCISKLLAFSVMSFTTILLSPVSQILLRSYVISEISPDQAGWWEGMNRISGMYLNVITSAFSIYYLPQLSATLDKQSLKNEIKKAYKMIISIMLLSFPIIYFFRGIIIRLLFTPEFMPMEQLFMWQLLGDFFKISSWLLSFVMVAKGMVKEYVLTEIVFSLIFLGLAFILIQRNSVVGITQAYFINYTIYMLFMCFFFRKRLLSDTNICI